MSYDLYLLQESDTVPRQAEDLDAVLSDAMQPENTEFVPSYAQAQQVETVEAELGAIGVPIIIGYAAPDVIAINVSYSTECLPVLETMAERLNDLSAGLGDAWFFYDPQRQATTQTLDPKDIHAVFEDVLASEKRAPGLAGTLGVPARRSARQKRLDLLVFAALALLVLYIFVWK